MAFKTGRFARYSACGSTGLLDAFFLLRICLALRPLATEAFEGFVGLRLGSSWPSLLNVCLRRDSARSRFLSWLLSSRHVTATPVGRWVIRTAESAVFTPCPPGPCAWKVSIRHCARSAASERAARRRHLPGVISARVIPIASSPLDQNSVMVNALVSRAPGVRNVIDALCSKTSSSSVEVE